MNQEDTVDPWDHIKHDFGKQGNSPMYKKFKSDMERKSAEKGMDKLKKSLDKLSAKVSKEKVITVPKNPAILTMKERYEKAWKIVFNRLPEWRRKELTESQKNGSFGTRDWDTDFVRQVAVLAESDDPLTA